MITNKNKETEQKMKTTKYKIYTKEQKIEYYTKRVRDINNSLNEREFASKRIKQLSVDVNRNKINEITTKKIPLIDRNDLTPKRGRNYAITKKKGSGSHPVIPLNEINGIYSIIGTSSDVVRNEKTIPIKSLEYGKRGITNVVLKVGTRTASRKKQALTSKIFDRHKEQNRPLRTLSRKEKSIIVNLLNASEYNRDIYYNDFLKYAKRKKR